MQAGTFFILELPMTPSGWLDWEVHEHEVDQCRYG